ncbi:MAG: DNA polymerase I [Candidatus Poribacteria bacterium]
MSKHETQKQLFLIDGTVYAFRAFHAVEQLTTSEGIPTGAIFVFTKMLMKLLEDENPEYMAVVFDAGGETERDRLYEEYKANRPEVDDSLVQQFPYMRQIIEALGIPMVEMRGFEADDIIATLTKQAEAEGFKVRIFTNDKDMLQLLSPNVKVYRSDRQKVTVYDEKSFKKRYKIEPRQMPDYLGLMGDKIDNIPGVSGIGEKSIPTLLEQFGTIENILEHIDEIDNKRWQKLLRDGKDNAILSKELAVLRTDIKLDITPEDCKLSRYDNEKLTEIFHQLEFKSLMKNIKVTIDPSRYAYHTVLTESELEELTDKLQSESVGEFSIDLETTDVDAMRAKIVGVAISLKPNEAYYIPVYYELLDGPKMLSEDYVLGKLKPFLEDDKVSKIGHNIKYDLEVLKRSGVDINGVGFDTMIASYLLNPSASGHKLDDVAFKYLQRRMIPIKDLIGSGSKQITMSQVPVEKVSDYACEDAEVALHLKYILEPQLVEHDLEDIFSNLELPLIPVLAEMEMAGVKIDTAFLRELSVEYEKHLQEMTEQIYELAGGEFNINSPKQLGEVLFDKLKLPRFRRTKTGYSTDEKVLNTLASHHELPALILEYRKFAKLKSTYTDALIDLINPYTGRLHTSFNQAVTATGRLSSSNPNLQNIPVRTERGREIRRAFIAEGDDKVLLTADYSQIELRILAHLSKDERLVEAFEKDEDIHSYAASLVFGVPIAEVTAEMRGRAKTMNYGIVYGIGAMRLANELKIDVHEAQAFIDNYFQTYAGVKTYFDRTIQEAREKGYVTTLMGRRRYVPEIQGGNRNIRAFGERIAINTPVQGSSADLIKVAMLKVADYLKSTNKQTRMVLQVHDELVFEAPKDELKEVTEELRRIMETALPMDVPIKVDVGVGQNWLEAK